VIEHSGHMLRVISSSDRIWHFHEACFWVFGRIIDHITIK